MVEYLPEAAEAVVPSFPGDLTIAHVFGIEEPLEYGRGVEAWARSAWEAYRDLQLVAREWLAWSSARITGRRRQ